MAQRQALKEIRKSDFVKLTCRFSVNLNIKEDFVSHLLEILRLLRLKITTHSI